MLSDLKIRFRLLSDDPNEPTVRHRCLSLLPEFKRRGMNIDVWDGYENADVIVLQYTPTDAKKVSRYCDYIIADVNDAIFLPTHPAAKLFWETAEEIDYWTTGSQRIAKHLSDKINPHCVSYMPEIVDIMYKNVQSNCDDSLPVIMSMGLADNIIFINPVIPILNKLSHNFKFKMNLVYPESIDANTRTVSKLVESKFPIKFVHWTKKSVVDTLKISNIGIAPQYINEWCRCKSPNRAAVYAWCGLGLITQDIESYHEIITQGKSGMLATTADEWEESFITMFDKEKRISMAAEAQAIVRERFTPCSIVDEWETVLQKVVL